MKTRLAICVGNALVWGAVAWAGFGQTFGLIIFLIAFVILFLALALCAVAGAGEND